MITQKFADDVKALMELAEEISNKYQEYISISAFPNGGAYHFIPSLSYDCKIEPQEDK